MRRFRKLIAGAALIALFAMITESAYAQNASAEEQFMNMLNGERAAAGLPVLPVDGPAVDLSRRWSSQMMSSGSIYHNPNLGSDYQGEHWAALGENVGIGSSVEEIHSAWMGSPSHRANVLGDYHRAGIGVVQNGSTMYVTAIFWKGGAASQGASSAAPASGTKVSCKKVRKRVVCKKVKVKKKVVKKKRRR